MHSGVEAFLDDGRPDVLAARVVAVVDREQRATSGDRRRRQRPRRDPRMLAEVGGRQSAADLGDGTAVLALEEHRRAIAVEQDHRMVDQAGQDPVEVEPAADVAGHPAQRLGAVEQVGHLVGSLGAADDGTRSRRPRPARARRRGSASDPRASPTTCRTPHGGVGPGIATASSGRPSGRTASAHRPAPRRAARPGSGPRPVRPRPAASSSVRPSDPERPRQVGQAGRSQAPAPRRDGPGRQPLPPSSQIATR